MDGDDDVDPQPQPQPQPQPLTTDGAYAIRSQYDVTVDAVLPEQPHELVITLDNFSTAPAHTLLDLAEQAGVPAVGTIRDALPSSLESRLEGWIDDQIAKVAIAGVPITTIAGDLADLAQTTLTRFAIDGELVLDGTTATHRLTRLDFAPGGANVALSLGALPATTVTATTTATVSGSSLAIGEHAFGLPYGVYAWQAFESLTVTRYGATPRQLLGDAVDCPAIAAAVASKCVLGVCVGHQAELTSICEAGLDEVVAVAQRKIEAMVFEAIHLASGTAAVVDADHDGRCDRLDGMWNAQIDVSQGLRSVPATFTASR